MSTPIMKAWRRGIRRAFRAQSGDMTDLEKMLKELEHPSPDIMILAWNDVGLSMHEAMNSLSSQTSQTTSTTNQHLANR